MAEEQTVDIVEQDKVPVEPEAKPQNDKKYTDEDVDAIVSKKFAKWKSEQEQLLAEARSEGERLAKLFNGYEWVNYIFYKGDSRYFSVKTTDNKWVFAKLTGTQTKLSETPAAMFSQETGKMKVLDDDYDLVINGVEGKLVKN